MNENFQNNSTTLFVKNMICKCCIKVLKQELENNGIVVNYIRLGEVNFTFDIKKISLNQIEEIIKNAGFGLLTDKEKILVEQIKISVIELVHYSNNTNSLIRNSDYLIDKLGYTYQYLSNVFSKHENITLEKFIILQKIEKVKELLEYDEFTLSEISYMMGYSSVQYLSNQFKAITGFTVSDYKKNVLHLRNSLDNLSNK